MSFLSVFATFPLPALLGCCYRLFWKWPANRIDYTLLFASICRQGMCCSGLWGKKSWTPYLIHSFVAKNFSYFKKSSKNLNNCTCYRELKDKRVQTIKSSQMWLANKSNFLKSLKTPVNKESPTWLLRKGKKEAARLALQTYRSDAQAARYSLSHHPCSPHPDVIIHMSWSEKTNWNNLKFGAENTKVEIGIWKEVWNNGSTSGMI